MANDEPQKNRPLLRIAKYEVKRHIATGGMGAVYKAYDVELRRTVALKVLSPDMASRPNMLERFRREARSAAKLSHENIVALYDCDEANGVHYLAMEYVEGVDLHQLISRKKRLSVDDAKSILMQAVRALDHAHAQGIVHRDIKPSNFLLAKKDGKRIVKLADMGLARFINEEDARVTNPGTTVGTVDYISPEQARNSASADIRSDIYSLGCTFYHMLAGVAPFAHGSMSERLLMHLETEPQDIRQFNPDVPANIWQILKKMLAKKPEDRYQTPAELLEDLENPETIPSEPPSQEKRISALAALALEEGGEDPEHAAHQLKKKRLKFAKTDRVGSAAERERRGPSVPRRSRRMDDDAEDAIPLEDDARSPRGIASRLPAWWSRAAGVLILVALVSLGLHLFSGGDDKPAPTPPDTRANASVPLANIPVIPSENLPEKKVPDEPKEDVPPSKKEVPAELQGPEPPTLPALFVPAKPLVVAALEKSFLGPFLEATPVSTKPRLVRVGRNLPTSADTCNSLAEALARSTEDAIIEIQDNGPLFVKALSAITKRRLSIRAGPGFRPLLAWDVEPGKDVLLALEQSQLALENLDFVVQWPEQAAATRPAVIRLRSSELACKFCTFSLTGKTSTGLTAVQIVSSAEPTIPLTPPDNRVALRQCYLRGAGAVALRIEQASADVLVDGALLVGGENPLFLIQGREEDSVTVRLLRSTAICEQSFLRSHPVGSKVGPRLHGFLLDAIVARSNFLADSGDVLHLGDTSLTSRLSWQAVNVLYAGWINLLRSSEKTISVTALKAWRDQWHASEGDRVLEVTWPREHPRMPAEIPASYFYAYDTPAEFAAISGRGPLGCVIGKLPSAPVNWLTRTYDWAVPPLAALPEIEVPPIPVENDKLYHGEKLDLTKVDLGQYLTAKLESVTPGPRVVMHLTGSGEIQTSPLRVKGVKELVLCVLPKAKTQPMTLVPKVFVDRPALFDIHDGNLELIGVRCKIDNRRSALTPNYVIRARNGKVVLYRCHLQGPLNLLPVIYKGLVRFEHEPRPQADLRPLVIRDSVFISGRKLIDLVGAGIAWRSHNSLYLALDDGVHLDLGTSPAAPRSYCELEKNTVGVRGAWFTISGASGSATEPLLLESLSNYYVDPFVDASSRAALLRLPAPLLASGLVRWQGKNNAYQGFSQLLDLGSEGRSRAALSDWISLWGTPAEISSVTLKPLATAAFALDSPQLDRLVFPVGPIVTPPVPGADLNRLGILKRK